MKKLLIIIGGILAITVVVLLIWLWIRSGSNSNTQPNSPVQFPTGSTVSGTDSTASGRDFLSDPQTKEDQSNPGYYFLGNQPSEAAPYVIQYIAETKHFTISLLQEPLGQARTKAEAYLIAHTGMSKDELCSLDYIVSTPDSVSSTYSDENLGFSFCPGAVQLPY